MTLKELLNSAEAARTRSNRSWLIGELVNRLRIATDALKIADSKRDHDGGYHGYDGLTCPENCTIGIMRKALREIEAHEHIWDHNIRPGFKICKISTCRAEEKII